MLELYHAKNPVPQAEQDFLRSRSVKQLYLATWVPEWRLSDFLADFTKHT